MEVLKVPQGEESLLGRPISNRFWLIMAAHNGVEDVNGQGSSRPPWHIAYALHTSRNGH